MNKIQKNKLTILKKVILIILILAFGLFVAGKIYAYIYAVNKVNINKKLYNNYLSIVKNELQNTSITQDKLLNKEVNELYYIGNSYYAGCTRAHGFSVYESSKDFSAIRGDFLESFKKSGWMPHEASKSSDLRFTTTDQKFEVSIGKIAPTNKPVLDSLKIPVSSVNLNNTLYIIDYLYSDPKISACWG